MKVGDIREQIAFMDDDDEIRFAAQPNRPMEYRVSNSISVVDGDNGKAILYLAESRQIGYLPENVRCELGWD